VGEEGLTIRSALAIVYAGVVFLPIVIFLYLIAGVSAAGAVGFTTALLFSELARIYGKPLKKQEIYIILYQAGGAAGGFIASSFYAIIFWFFFMTTPYASGFIDPVTGLELQKAIGHLKLFGYYWVAPSHGSTVYLLRGFAAFLDPQWSFVIALGMIGALTWYMIEVPLTFIMASIFLEAEPLPFPYAPVDAAICTSLSERRPEQFRLFTFTSLLGAAYGLLIYVLPTISTIVFGAPFSILPFPWIDMTRYIGLVIPGALFGIATDLASFASGMVVPWTTAISMLAGSLITQVIGNALAYDYPVFPQWETWHSLWGPTASLMYLNIQSGIWVWLNPIFGLGLSVAIVYVVTRYKSIIAAFRSITRFRYRGASIRGHPVPPLPFLITSMFLGFAINITLFSLMVPQFPLWIAIIISVGWTFIYALVNTRALGETAQGMPSPDVWSVSVLGLGVKGIEPFLATPYLGGTGAPSWVYALRLADLTETRWSSFFKSFLIAVPVWWIFTFIYLGLFWSLAPIPSEVFPFFKYTWPVEVVRRATFLTRSVEFFNFQMIGYGVVIGTIVGLSIELFLKKIYPISFIGLVVGASSSIPFMFTFFLGGLVGKILEWRLGETWRKNRAVAVAGIISGNAVVVGLGIAFIMMVKSMWLLPY